MIDEKENRLLREQALAFFGAITASLSHEINNSVAIITELSGLQEDLLLGAGQGQSIDSKKMLELSQRITEQVKKGRGLIKRLNHFAHTADNAITDYDLRESLDQISALAQRFAFLKGVNLEAGLENKSIRIRGNPFELQQAVFICIRLLIDSSNKDETIAVTFEKEGRGARILMTGRSLNDTEEVESRLSFLAVLMKELCGKVEIIPLDDELQSLALHIPMSIVESQPA
jgi:C4-dicarboxylate-specific signal transduction histidine kinase